MKLHFAFALILPWASPLTLQSQETANSFHIRVENNQSGESLEGVSLTLRASSQNNDEDEKWEGKTGADGALELQLPESVEAAWATTSLKGFVSHYARVQRGKPYTFLCDPSVTYGATVVDEAGAPIEGAEVKFDWQFFKPEVPQDERQWARQHSIKTDSEGRWEVPNVSAYLYLGQGWPSKSKPLARIRWFHISHPEHEMVDVRKDREHWSGRFEDQSAIVTLKGTPEISGTVINAEGDPLDSAEVREMRRHFSGYGKTTASSENGTYSIHLRPGNHRLLIAADNHVSHVRDIEVTPGRDQEIEMIVLERTTPLTIRTADENGTPLAGIQLYLDEIDPPSSNASHPYNFAERKTDEEGMAVWMSPPPPGTWIFSTWAEGYYSIRDRRPDLEGNTLTLALSTATRVSGLVTDASTGLPIPRFTILHGQRMSDGSDTFIEGNTQHFNRPDGTFEFELSEEYARVFRVGADGYVTKLSREYSPTASEKKPVENFALRPVGQLPGIKVTIPDENQSAAGGAKLFTTQNEWLFFENGDPSKSNRMPHQFIGDESGRIAFPSVGDSFRGWILHEDGFSPIKGDDLSQEEEYKTTLTPFSSAEGSLLVDGKPGAGRTLRFETWIKHSPDATKSDLWSIEVTANDQGEYNTDQLIPEPFSQQSYRVYLVDEEESQRYREEVDTFTLGPGENPVVNLEFEEASRSRLRGRFVDRHGNPFEDFEYASVYINPVENPVGFMYHIPIEKDGSFSTIPFQEGRYTISGSLRFRNDLEIQMKLFEFAVPNNTTGQIRTHELDPIQIEYPVKPEREQKSE